MPAAGWWLVGLLLLGVGVVPLQGADTDLAQARADVEAARAWVGTTVVVEGTYDRIDDVRDVATDVQRADAVYVVTLPDGATAEVRKPARRDDGVLRPGLQPEAFQLRVVADDVSDLTAPTKHRAVQWGARLKPAEVTARQRQRAVEAAETRATQVRVLTVVGAVAVLGACAAATVAAARRPGRRRGWFAGTRAAETEHDPEVLERAATSAELPVAMALLVGLVVVRPLGWQPVSLLVLAGLVTLSAVALLAREHEALGRSRSADATDPGRRRRAVLLRSAGVVGVVGGLAMGSQGVGVVVLSALALVAAWWQRPHEV